MRPIRVLVVDDNHLLRRLLELVLEEAGYLPVAVESGRAALDLALEDPPDAWIVDDRMPGISGADLVRLLRRADDPRLAAAPVVGISAHRDGARSLLEAGATAFVPKPVEEERLLATLARVMAMREVALDLGADGAPLG